MTQKQYDLLYLTLQSLTEEVKSLKDEVYRQSLLIDALQKKTIVISDIDKKVDKLEIDVQSLKDEQEA